MKRKHYIYAHLSLVDQQRVIRIAAEMKLSQSGFVRMCINDWLESGDEGTLQEVGKPGRRKAS